MCRRLMRPAVSCCIASWPFVPWQKRSGVMKIRNSLRSLRGRHRDNQLVRRKGRIFIINKTQKRFKAKQA